jgi:hypothetical protein
MSLRLVMIGIYSRFGNEVRRVRFNRYGLSIVTGRSQRGKSALLDIADYCLLSKHCRIPKGRIRDTVSHVGAVFQDDLDRHFTIVRSIPNDGGATSSDVYVGHGQSNLPDTKPVANANVDVAKEDLSEFVGIEALPVLTNDRDAEFEKQHPANIRHCAPFLFQPQDVVASRSVLFPGLDDIWVRRHVSDAVDYFLGVLTVERLALRRELHDLIAQRNAAKREVLERERRSARGWERGLELWSEAAALRLVAGAPPETNDKLFELLHKTAGIEIASAQSATDFPKLEDVQKREAELRGTLRKLRYELAEIDRLTSTRSDFDSAASSQLARLRIRDLLPASEDHACPLCRTGVVDATEIEAAIKDGVLSLESSRAVPARLVARLEQRRTDLRREIADALASHKPLQAELQQLFQLLAAEQSVMAEVQRRARFVGRVQEYLSAVGVAPEKNDKLGLLERRIAELQNAVGDATLRKLRDDARATLGDRITRLAMALDVEFPGKPARINFDSFSIEIQFDKNWVRLNEIGSGANWVGYHLAAVVGLQEQLIVTGNPVPRFLMIDQPSQAWFPAEVAEITGKQVPVRDTDLASVRRVFDFLDRHSKGVGSPQIIVSDHALLDDNTFRAAIVENWHGEEGLVPQDWTAS